MTVSNAPGEVVDHDGSPTGARPHEHSRTGLSADALHRAIADHLAYSIARPPSVLTPEHYYPRTRPGRARSHAAALDGHYPGSAARPGQSDVLPVRRVPDGPAAGQQPAQPAHRGPGSRSPRRTGGRTSM